MRQKVTCMPSTKLIAFRLADDARYGQRYDSLTAHVRSENQTRFDELTAAYLIHHVDHVTAILDRIKRLGGIYLDGRDMVLVMDLSTLERDHIGIEAPGMLDFVLACGRPSPIPPPNALGSIMRPALGNALMRPRT